MFVEFMLQKPPIMQTRLRLRMVVRGFGEEPNVRDEQRRVRCYRPMAVGRRVSSVRPEAVAANREHAIALGLQSAMRLANETRLAKTSVRRDCAEPAIDGVWGTPLRSTAGVLGRSSLELTMAPRRRWETKKTGVVR